MSEINKNDVDISKYDVVPKDLLTVGVKLAFDIFVYMANPPPKLITFRHAGDVLDEGDIASIAKIPPVSLLFPKNQRAALLAQATAIMGDALAAGQVDSPQIKAQAASMLRSVTPPPYPNAPAGQAIPPPPPGTRAEAMNELSGQVEKMILQFKAGVSKDAYEQAIKQSKGDSDPLSAHQRQVSAIAVLILLSAGGAGMDDLTDLETAGMIHDLALKNTPNVILNKHLAGQDGSLVSAEKLLYFRHIEDFADTMNKLKMSVTPGALRTVTQHHENFNGSGLKGMAGQGIFWLARYLHVADDLVATLNGRDETTRLQDVVKEMSDKTDQGLGLYDPDVIKALKLAVGA